MSVSVELTFRWPMGHRILGLEGAGAKCRNIHGHNWTAIVSLPNDDGKLEFGEVKKLVGDWIEHNLDHGFCVAAQDPFVHTLADMDSKRYVLPYPPTTEAIATELSRKVQNLTGVCPLSVHVVEGYRNAATWKQDT